MYKFTGAAASKGADEIQRLNRGTSIEQLSIGIHNTNRPNMYNNSRPHRSASLWFANDPLSDLQCYRLRSPSASSLLSVANSRNFGG